MDFSYVLIDIHDQLNEIYWEERVDRLILTAVYRGQRMGMDEFQKLKLNIGGFISNNTLLSTNFNRNVAEIYAGGANFINCANVLIEISCDSTSSAWKPFADVSAISQISDEQEVLFPNGHIFRIDSCELITNNIWFLQLTLCDNSNPIVQDSSDYFDSAILQLLEILPKISPKTNKANDRMLQWWRFYCADDPIEQAKIDQFEESYRSDTAIRWYNKDSFLYRLLNTVLRHENIDMIIDFRYFIIDLYEQLTKSHLDYVRSFKNSSLTVYRSQKISLLKLRRLKHNIGNYISIKLLSSEVALCFAELNESDRKRFLQLVLFKIDIDMGMLVQSCKSYIFVNIINK